MRHVLRLVLAMACACAVARAGSAGSPPESKASGAAPRSHFRGRLAGPVRHEPDRRTYLRARVIVEDGEFLIHPAAAQGSGQISSLVEANALAVIPEGREGLERGERAEIIPLWEFGEGQAGLWIA